MKLCILPALLSACLLLAVGCSFDWNDDTGEPLVDEIVFESNRDGVAGGGRQDLYRVGLDGGGLFRLTNTPEDEADPSISPDGKYIAYTRGTVGEDIFIMPARGGMPRQITFYSGSDYKPAWSANGQQLVFTSERVGRYELYIIDRDGKNRRRLTFRPDSTDWVSAGAFSPDGKRVVFESWEEGSDYARLYTIGLDGSNLQPLTIDVPLTRSAAWSPDGRHIAFVGAQSRLAGHALYIFDLQTKKLTRLLTLFREATVPSWSPDGDSLVFENQNEYGESGIYVIRLDGSGLYRVTPGDAGAPSWSPSKPSDSG